jgi:ribonuclease P protein component
MDSVRASQPRAAERSLPGVAQEAAKACQPDMNEGRAPAMTGTRHHDTGRLRKRSEFLAVRRGKKSRGPLFLLEMRSRGDEGPPRIGFTVTRKQGNAVERNRIRRRLREAIRSGPDRDMQAGNDYVIVGRRDVLTVPFDKLRSELSRRIRGKADAGAKTRHEAFINGQ